MKAATSNACPECGSTYINAHYNWCPRLKLVTAVVLHPPCLVCGEPGGHSGLPCPTTKPMASAQGGE